MDTRCFYGHTRNRVRVNDREGVQILQEDIVLEPIPENEDSGEESDGIEDEIENFRTEQVFHKILVIMLVILYSYIFFSFHI